MSEERKRNTSGLWDINALRGAPTDTPAPETTRTTPPTDSVTPPADHATPPTDSVTPPADRTTPPTDSATPLAVEWLPAGSPTPPAGGWPARDDTAPGPLGVVPDEARRDPHADPGREMEDAEAPQPIVAGFLQNAVTSPRAGIVAGAVVLVLAVIGVVAVVVHDGQATPGASTVTHPFPVSPTVDGLEPARAADTSGGDVQTPPAATPGSSESTTEAAEATALDTLNRIHSQDLATVQLDGRYVAQLASKSVGIVDALQTAAAGSHVFLASDILAEHEALRGGDNAGARVVLLLSTDYGAQQLYQGQPLWVTFAIADFASADAVDAWCANRFPTLSGDAMANQCVARRLEPVHG